MALDFSVENMKNYDVLTTLIIPEMKSGDKTFPEQTKWHPITDALIWATMSLGMNRITKENWEEFYYRLHLKEQVMGPSLIRASVANREENYITPMEVYMHIGLSTNASSKTLAQFLKDIYGQVERDTSGKVRKAPELYDSLGLEQMTKDEFQAAQRVEDRRDNAPLEQMLERYQKTGSTLRADHLLDDPVNQK